MYSGDAYAISQSVVVVTCNYVRQWCTPVSPNEISQCCRPLSAWEPSGEKQTPGGSNPCLFVSPYRFLVVNNFDTPSESVNGNFGLLDQRACLEWVQNNIAAFGGDKTATAGDFTVQFPDPTSATAIIEIN